MLLYREVDLVAAVKAIAPQGVAAVFDGVGRDTFVACLDCVRPFGMLVNYGNASGHPPPIDLLQLAKRGSLSICRPALSSFITDVTTMRAAAAELFELVERGILKIEISRTYALHDAAHCASRHREQGICGVDAASALSLLLLRLDPERLRDLGDLGALLLDRGGEFGRPAGLTTCAVPASLAAISGSAATASTSAPIFSRNSAGTLRGRTGRHCRPSPVRETGLDAGRNVRQARRALTAVPANG